MAKIYGSTLELIGNTPLVEVKNIEKSEGLEATVLVKLEYFNPAGSVKDRIAKGMIEDAEARGVLKEGSTIIEPTSGNTGIGLAAIAASKGYRIILTMPETMSVERRNILKAYGAEVVLTDGAQGKTAARMLVDLLAEGEKEIAYLETVLYEVESASGSMPETMSVERRNILKAYGAEVVLTDGAQGMKGAIAKAEELAEEIPDSFIPGQFVNPANPKAHRETTGPEIWNDTDGQVDIFVAGVGTGGTLSGTGEYLKSKKPEVKVVAVEPETSPVLSEGKAGPHKIQGIGAGFVPDTLNTKVYDEIIKIANDDAFETSKLLTKKEGILTGISSGAALSAALQLAKRPENKGKTIVALLPDSGDRYYSTPLLQTFEIR